MNNKIDSYAHIIVLLWKVFEIFTQRKKAEAKCILVRRFVESKLKNILPLKKKWLIAISEVIQVSRKDF